MENNLPDRTPVLPVTENFLEKPLEIKQVRSKKPVFLSLLIVVLIITAFFLGYFFNKQTLVTLENTIVDQDKIAENEEDSAIATTFPANQKVVTEFLFITDPNKDVSYDLQAWLLSLDGSQKKLDLPDFSVAYKHPSSQHVFFVETKSEGVVSVKNILSGEIKQFELIKHPNLDVIESISINNLNSIAPDDSAFVYNVYFSEPCPPVTIPPGFEGGFGPCGPDPDPNLPTGYYLYDLKTKTNTFLGDVVLPSAWNLENQNFYFTTLDAQSNGLKMVNLDTKEVTMFDRAETFGHGAFPLLKSNLIIKIEGQTGDVVGQESSSVLSLYNILTKEKKVLDSGRWAAIQPFASVSPNETKFLYIRSTLDSQGRAIYSLHSYDFVTGQIKKVTPESMVSSYSIYGNWLDEDNFVTMVNETGTNHDNGRNYLVKIDLNNEQVIKLTDDSVYRFNQN